MRGVARDRRIMGEPALGRATPQVLTAVEQRLVDRWEPMIDANPQSVEATR